MVIVIVVSGMVMVICFVCILIGRLVFCKWNWFVFVCYSILVFHIVFSVVGKVIVILILMSRMIWMCLNSIWRCCLNLAG